jgi:DHA1 family bicyclomycin/chloramphenicol resistance-like MFS transporter
VQALGGCAEMVIARAIVRDRFAPRDAVRVFSGLVLVMGVAPIVAPLLGGFLDARFGWRAIFWLLSLVGVALMAVTFLCLRETLPPERRVRETPMGVARVYGSLLRDRPFMSYALVTGLISAGLFAYVGGSPVVFMTLFGVPRETFGWYFGAVAAGLIGMSQVNGQLVRRGVDPGRIMRVALCAASVAGAALLTFALLGRGGFWPIYLSIFAAMASCGFIFPNAGALAMAPHGRHAGNASALLGFVQFALSGLGGFAESGAAHAASPSAVPMAVTMTTCLMAACAIALAFAPRGATLGGMGDAGAH